MRRRESIRLLLPLLLASSCAPDKRADPGQGKITPKTPAAPKVPMWPPRGFTRVTGYRFESPKENPMFSVAQQASIVGGRIQLDPALLAKITVASRELSASQAERLQAAVFKDLHYEMPSACYEPHHLFEFRNARNEITGLIEICFKCHGIHVIPDNPAHMSQKHDFGELAKLCMETGLGMAP